MIYRDEELNALAQIFGVIEDPRDERGKQHRLIDIFIMTIYGTLWGHTDFVNMVEELKYHEKYFTKLLGLANGIPSHDTFSAVFSMINASEFMECFITWIAGIVNTRGKHIAIDGKAVKAACDKVHGKNVPYLVNAYIVDEGLSMAHIRVDEKTNEIKGIPELLEWIDIEGAVVTIDAIGCQKDIVEIITNEKKADFVLAVKDNQQMLKENISMELYSQIANKKAMDAKAIKFKEKGLIPPEGSENKLDVYEDNDMGHSRIERRTYYVFNDNESIDTDEWLCINSIGMVIRERLVIKRNEDDEIIDEKASTETVFYVMSKEMSAEEFSCYVRGHWGIENGLHWVLDDYFREDRCTSRKGYATENLSLMRKCVFDLMKLDENVADKSMKAKQVYYRNNPDAIERLIFRDIPSKY